MLDGLRRDEQLGADIAVGHAQQQQFGDLTLAVRQPRRRRARRAGARGVRCSGEPSSPGASSTRDGLLEIAGQLQHRARRPVRRGSAARPGPASRVASQVRPNCDSARAAAVTSSMSTWLASTRSQVRPAIGQRLGECAVGRGGRQRLAVRRHRFGRIGQDSGVHTRPSATAPTTTADCRATRADRTPRRGCAAADRPDASARRRSTTRRAAAGRRGPSEYSASTSIAAYQCFCIAPLSPLRRAIAVCSAAAHSASRRCRAAGSASESAAAATSAVAAGNWPSCILTQPSSSRCLR